MSETSSTSIPCAPEAERVVLGSAMIDGRHATTAVAELLPADFYELRHRQTFAAIASLVAEDYADINPLIVTARMRAEGTYTEGTTSRLADLTYGLPVMVRLDPYIVMLREKRTLRELAKFASVMALRITEPDATSNEVASWAESRLAELTEAHKRSAGGFRRYSEMADEMADRYARMFKNEVFTVPTGFPQIDANLTGGGFGLTNLVIVAGRASHGKTSFALDLAANAARAGFPAAVCSLEMERESLFIRSHSAEADVARWQIRSGIYQNEFHQLINTLDRMRSLDIHVADDVANVEDLCGKARRLVRQHGVRLVVVDYLQLLTTEERVGSRNNEVGGIARKLKNLALSLKVPVIALSQFSRDHDREGREPELRDLRDSGEIEQHADAVFLLFGDKPEENVTYRQVTVKCAKQREGKLFREELTFDGDRLTFRPVATNMRDDAER